MDPIRFLDLEGLEWEVAKQVVLEAARQDQEIRTAHYKNMVLVIAGGIGRAFRRAK